MRGRAPRRATAAAVVLLLAGCVLAPNRPAPPVRSPSPSGSPSTASTEPPPSLDRRPIEDVPAVQPPGFVVPPPGQGRQRYLRQPVSWLPCGPAFECTTVAAPLDYARPDGQAITLALRRRPSSREPRLGSLFINPGGPGGSGVEYVSGFPARGLEQYDIVGWDPRGVGSSTPVQCFNGPELDEYLAADGTPDDAQERLALLNGRRDFGRSCLQRSGALLTHISTQETVRDLDLLRSLVGDVQLSYFGSSYGTKIGALYAQLFPKTVGRMVLDGAVNITADDTVSQTQGFERALGHFATWCARQRCRLGGTQAEVLGAVTDLWRRLDQQPLPGGRRELTQQLGIDGVLAALYGDERTWPVLRQALEAAVVDGNGAGLVGLADVLNERRRDGTFGQLNFGFPAVRCLDTAEVSVRKAEARAAAVARAAPVLGPFNGADLTCPTWPVPPAPREPRITAAGAPPIVVIGTTGDPATPYEYAEGMARQLESGLLVSLQGEGHLAYGKSACVREKVIPYLTRGQAPADGTRC